MDFFISIVLFALFFTARTAADDAATLLAFRNSSIAADPFGYLESWTTTDGEVTGPCSWNGVDCSADGRVTGLDLGNQGLKGVLRIGDLMALPSLEEVDLHGNMFSGSLSYPVGNRCNFVRMDLSANNFSGAVPGGFLIECERLFHLNLSGNSITGGIVPFRLSIRELDLSRNKIGGPELLTFSLTNCKFLNYLNLSNNKIDGNLRGLSDCTDLVAFDLSNNELSGGIPAWFFSDLPPSLTQLFLTNNNFTGDFSEVEFGNCMNVAMLDVSSNSLEGAGLPPSIVNCQQLQSLDLSGNGFTGTIPSFLPNLTMLKRLSLADNSYTGEIPPELSGLCRSLLHLDLSSNMLTGGLPSSFIGCPSIQILNLGKNNLSGDFVDTVVRTFPSLTHLLLPFNHISGNLPLLSLRNCTQLEVIDFSSNNFTGPIPTGFCSESLWKILLQNNFLNGRIPAELADCTSLVAVDVSFNELEGPIPPEIFELPSLSEFIGWANRISGELPDNLCSTSVALEILIVNHNIISGGIPASITNCRNLAWLSLSGNRLSGTIPETIGNLEMLAMIQLANNSLSGEIPMEIGKCKSLIWLDLYSNKLSGSIPVTLAANSGLITPSSRISGKRFAMVRNLGGSVCPGFGDIFYFEGIRQERFLNHRLLHGCPKMRVYPGRIQNSFRRNGSMVYIDLSHNFLTGPIPENVGSMAHLRVLSVSQNRLTGGIPRSFGGLRKVGILDLSHNNLSGSIPVQLESIGPSMFDVSYNNLSGPIPSSGKLMTFPASRFAGNPGLCGLPLPPCTSSSDEQEWERDSISSPGGKRRVIGLSVAVGIAISAFIVLVLVLVLFRVKKSQRADELRSAYVESLPKTTSSTWKISGVLEPLNINVSTFEKPIRKLTFAHLLDATSGFSVDSLIGSGGFGEVYKARLKDGMVVAIKKLIHDDTNQGNREFVAEMETIGKIRHRHLVPLLGYCKVGEERLLVYEYMRHGSLEKVLVESKAEGGLELDWATRRKIAIGSAKGLAFLHHNCIPHIIHRDMKSSNVLVDENLDARVSDFGMARLVNVAETHLSVSSLTGTPGYVPPEYYQSFRCTTKGDVYSYGVVLLELLTGKKPIDPEFGDNNLVGWAKQMAKENRFGEVIDPQLLGQPSEEADIFRVLRIACDCLEDRPLRRPTMVQVLSMFKEIEGDSADSDILEGISVESTVIDES